MKGGRPGLGPMGQPAPTGAHPPRETLGVAAARGGRGGRLGFAPSPKLVRWDFPRVGSSRGGLTSLPPLYKERGASLSLYISLVPFLLLSVSLHLRARALPLHRLDPGLLCRLDLQHLDQI
jgi:hypothetical protein